MTAFDDATAVIPLGPGRYAADLHPEWSVAGRSNGGYLLALATRAALATAAGHPHPMAVTGSFAASAPAGPVGIDVEVLREGRSTSVSRVRVRAEGDPADPATATYLEVLVTSGELGGGDPQVPGPPPPAMPAEQDCPRAPAVGGPFPVPLLNHVAERFDPACLGWALGTPSEQGELRAWLRFDDGREPDLLGLVWLSDAMPPPTFDLSTVRFGWVPTLQLSVFLRAEPAPGPILLRTVARSVGAGAVDETADLWDSRGRLVAVAHQLALVQPR
jgi:acyl-CoA thioesterase